MHPNFRESASAHAGANLVSCSLAFDSEGRNFIELQVPRIEQDSMSSSTFIPDSLEDPQFIPGENIGTGNGEPILAPATRPREAPTEFGEVVRSDRRSTLPGDSSPVHRR